MKTCIYIHCHRDINELAFKQNRTTVFNSKDIKPFEDVPYIYLDDEYNGFNRCLGEVRTILYLNKNMPDADLVGLEHYSKQFTDWSRPTVVNLIDYKSAHGIVEMFNTCLSEYVLSLRWIDKDLVPYAQGVLADRYFIPYNMSIMDAERYYKYTCFVKHVVDSYIDFMNISCDDDELNRIMSLPEFYYINPLGHPYHQDYKHQMRILGGLIEKLSHAYWVREIGPKNIVTTPVKLINQDIWHN